MPESTGRPSPERLLEQVEEQERKARRGRLKIFLGYASGVGKSFQMLDEGRRRRERNREDVVVGAVQPHYPREVEQLLRKHEIIPPLKINGEDVIDVDAILRRHPEVVLIDGLAYNNPPASRNAKRWQDVKELLEGGISVITSVNLRHIEECQDEVECITGKRSRQTLPKSFLEEADDIVIVDAPADASLKRINGEPVSSDALLLEEQKLSRLREMALLIAAEVVDRQLESYLRVHGIEQVWGMQERVLVCITPRSDAARILESGRRNAERFHGELFAVYVRQSSLSKEDEAILERNLAQARELGAEIELLKGDPVDTIIQFARDRGVTQIFVGHSLKKGWWRRFWGNTVDRLIRSAEGIDVIVYPLAVHS